MMATIKAYACYTVKIYKYNPPQKKKFEQGGAPVLHPPLVNVYVHTHSKWEKLPRVPPYKG